MAKRKKTNQNRETGGKTATSSKGKNPARKPDAATGAKRPLSGGRMNAKTARPKEDTKASKEGYITAMSYAPGIDKGIHGLQLVPAAIFAAVAILIVRQFQYYRDMSGYYWSSASPDKPLVDFFSHYKAVCVEIAVALAVLVILYRLITQSFFIKKSILYIPMLVYLLFVLLSLAFSEHKDVAWMGWNDRFEGTLIILCYLVMLFYVINSVNSERNIKWILYPITGSAVLLSLIGISQATNSDFFRTTFGQKLIVPNRSLQGGGTMWQLIDSYMSTSSRPYLSFTFQHNEIYQTVYNINYVSFYLTLLIPLFALLFIREKQPLKKAGWGVVFALVLFNLFGSSSSGGMLGVFVVLLLAVVVLNRRLIKWWRSTLILLAILVGTGAGAYAVASSLGGYTWTSELSGAIRGAVGPNSTSSEIDSTSADGFNPQGTSDAGHKIDYFITKGNTLSLSLDGNEAKITITSGNVISMEDGAGNSLPIAQEPATGEIRSQDPRFSALTATMSQDEKGNSSLALAADGDPQQWNFTLTGEDKTDIVYKNDLGKTVGLVNVPHIGFDDNTSFGSGRGYIWSRTLPMIKDTILIGRGADNYILYFPHRDYVGKHNADWNINMIVDKPHNLYLGMAVNTGVISLLAFLALLFMYIVQSFRLYRKEEYDSFAAFAGCGIFLGICGFVVSAVTNDSSVSVMPMFYALLGAGIATNIMVRRRRDGIKPAEMAANENGAVA